MCGFLVTDAILDDENKVCSFLEHRGPDHTEIRTVEGINFTHTLLSLTGDFTPQPVTDEHITVVFNGEIYNHMEIRDELISNGYNFIGNSDTETLLNLYQHT